MILVVSALAVTTAFSIGISTRLGASMWPLLGASSVISTILFWAATLGLLVNMAGIVISVSLKAVRKQKTPKKSHLKAALVRFFTVPPDGFWGEIIAIGTMLVVFGVTLVVLFTQDATVLSFSYLIAAIFVYRVALIEALRPAFLLAFAALMLLTSTTFGSASVDILRYIGGEATVKFADKSDPIKVTVLTQTEHGIFVFVGHEEEVTFLPWDNLKYVKSAKTSTNLKM